MRDWSPAGGYPHNSVKKFAGFSNLGYTIAAKYCKH